MSVTGGHKRRVTRPGYHESPRDQPAWSPDGKRILFQFGTTMAACATLEIAVIKADGSGERVLTNNGVCDYVGTWSPDGRQIAFTSERTGASEVYVVASPAEAVSSDSPTVAAPHQPGPRRSHDRICRRQRRDLPHRRRRNASTSPHENW